MFIPCQRGYRLPDSEVSKDETPLLEESPTLIWCNPNAAYYEAMVYQSGILKFWLHRGCNLFLFNYAGYGRSSGKPSPSRVSQDGEAVVRFLKGRGVNNMGIYGRSIGGVAACYVARRFPEAGSPDLLFKVHRGLFSALPFENLTALREDWVSLEPWPLRAAQIRVLQNGHTRMRLESSSFKTLQGLDYDTYMLWVEIDGKWMRGYSILPVQDLSYVDSIPLNLKVYGYFESPFTQRLWCERRDREHIRILGSHFLREAAGSCQKFSIESGKHLQQLLRSHFDLELSLAECEGLHRLGEAEPGEEKWRCLLELRQRDADRFKRFHFPDQMILDPAALRTEVALKERINVDDTTLKAFEEAWRFFDVLFSLREGEEDYLLTRADAC
eukprot:g20642.t1